MLQLGSYRDLSLADARKTAKEMRARVALGYDVAGEKKERREVAVAKIEAERSAVTVAMLADEYFAARILGRWKHPNIVRSRIERDIKPAIGKLSIGDVRPSHIDAMLKGIVAFDPSDAGGKEGAQAMADPCRAGASAGSHEERQGLDARKPPHRETVADAGDTQNRIDRGAHRRI